MKLFGQNRRAASLRPSEPQEAERPESQSLSEAERQRVSQRVSEAGDRASRAAASGYTWTHRTPSRRETAEEASEAAATPAPTSSVRASLPRQRMSGATALDQSEPQQSEPSVHEPFAARARLAALQGDAGLASRGADAGATPTSAWPAGRSGEATPETMEGSMGGARVQSAAPSRRRRVWDVDDAPAAQRPISHDRAGLHDDQPHAALPDAAPDDTGMSSTRGDWLDRISRPDEGHPPSPSPFRNRRVAPQSDRPDAGGHDAGGHKAGGRARETARATDTGAEGAPQDDPVAQARAQLARMAEMGALDDTGGHTGEGSGGSRRAAAKTRVLGFRAPETSDDPMARPAAENARRGPDYPVGWLLVTEGAGRGASFALTSGVATIGRGADQTVRLDFGDTAISRNAHASIAFDDETNRFFLGSGATSNLVRLNGRPVLATEALADGDTIRLGETTLHLVALCGDRFSWTAVAAEGGTE